MKIVHTSDWHLGVSLEHAPRHEEHRRFLRWLLQHLETTSANALLISGDIFHYTQPSASAQKELYAFLASCNTIPTLRDVVLIAGNHDSPSRLEAPKQLLTALNIHVVGDYTDVSETVVPLHDSSGEVAAFVAAIPYLTESRLGVATTKLKPKEVRSAFVDAFKETYKNAKEYGHAMFGDVPSFAMGHLTCSQPDIEYNEGDFRTPLHLFQSIHGMPTEIFDGYDYAALGHIHRKHQVGNSNAWYCGSPVPINVTEARSDRFILNFDTETGVVAPTRVPSWRRVFELVGYEHEVTDMLESLSWDTELAPYLYIERLLDKPTRTGVEHFQSIITQRFDEPRPRIVGFKKRLTEKVETKTTKTKKPKLDELSPEDVFGMMFRQRFEQKPSAEIVNAFRTLLTGEDDEASK